MSDWASITKVGQSRHVMAGRADSFTTSEECTLLGKHLIERRTRRKASSRGKIVLWSMLEQLITL